MYSALERMAPRNAHPSERTAPRNVLRLGTYCASERTVGAALRGRPSIEYDRV
jgi:hypothetical protein